MNVYSSIVAEATTSTVVAGQFLQFNDYPAYRRAFLGADLLLERTHLVKPTPAQIAALCRVSESYVRAARRIAYSLPHLRAAAESGLQPLLEAAYGKRVPPTDDASLIELAKRVGVERWLGVGAAAGL